MDKPAALSQPTQPRDCWICNNNENNTNLTIVNSKKVLKNCRTYLDTSINVEEYFESDTSISCCNYCYESAVELIVLEKQVEKLGKEISELSSLFLENVVERRNHFKKEKNGSFDSFDRSTPTEDNIVVVPTEIVDCESPVSAASNSQGLTEIGDDLVNDIGIEEGDDEYIIHSEGDVEVKFSCGRTISNVVVSDDEQVEPNQEMSGTTAKDCQRSIKTSMTDLSKCFQMPIIQLERLKSCKSRKPKSDIDRIPSSDINLETVKTEKDIDEDENKSYKCFICEQYFIELCDLEDHEKLHKDVNHYSCSICNKSFLDPSRLKLHEKLHTTKRPLKSSLSPKSVSNSSRNLTAHKNWNSGDTSFKCSVCSKSFRNSSTLKNHKRIHNGERQYKCGVCPKSFPAPSDLKSHETVHTGEKPYNCTFCSKSFRIKSNLKKHEKTHAGERSYKCSSCSKSFWSAHGLKQHEKLHTGERPYKCSFCSKSFALMYRLKRHEIIHTRERPFKCSSCEMTFKLNHHLKYHRQHKHGETTEEFILP